MFTQALAIIFSGMKVNTFIILCFLFLNACKNENINPNSTVFEGVVLGYSDGLPISGASVTIVRADQYSVKGLTNKIENQVITNNEGYYSFMPKISEEKLIYKSFVSKEGYVQVENPKTLGAIINQDAQNIDTLILGRAAYISLHIMNINTTPDTLAVSVFGTREKPFGEGLFVASFYQFERGIDRTDHYQFAVKDFKTLNIVWSSRNEKLLLKASETINLYAGININYEIKY